MQAIKISLLFFILQINLSAQETRIMYSPLCEDSRVMFVDAYEVVVEVKCYEEKSDTAINFILLNKIRNFSNQDLIWELTKCEIYSNEEQFKPVGYQFITNNDYAENSLPEVLNIKTLEDIEVKSKSILSILLLFSKWQDTDKYEMHLADVDADIIVGNAWLKNKQKEEYVFRMIYFKEAE